MCRTGCTGHCAPPTGPPSPPQLKRTIPTAKGCSVHVSAASVVAAAGPYAVDSSMYVHDAPVAPASGAYQGLTSFDVGECSYDSMNRVYQHNAMYAVDGTKC